MQARTLRSSAAIAAANTGDAGPYGADDWTSRAANELSAAFGAVSAYFVFNGTAANVLGISLLLRPFDSVICAESSHLHVDECGATERNLGNKVVTVPTPDGKLTPELIAPRLTGRGDEHRVQARVVEIAQVTELGTCYSLDELRRLSEFCRAEGLYLFIDGARLANAVAYLELRTRRHRCSRRRSELRRHEERGRCCGVGHRDARRTDRRCAVLAEAADAAWLEDALHGRSVHCLAGGQALAAQRPARQRNGGPASRRPGRHSRRGPSGTRCSRMPYSQP